MRPCLVLALALTLPGPLPAQVDTIPAPAEFRGIHAVNDRVVWASGSKGVIARTVDGRAWTFDTVAGADSIFMVDIWAKDAKRAWAVGTNFSGGYAAIYHTRDGGATWTRQWELRHADAFLDGIACTDDRHCVVIGDPHEGNYLLLTTADGGTTWGRVPVASLPPMLPGEAAFAASGTEITARGRTIWFATGGGHHARVWKSADRGTTWTVAQTPLPASASAGLFGIAMQDARTGLAAGGDYRLPADSSANLLRTTDGGATWTVAGRTTPLGVRWGITSAGRGVFVATAPTGSGITRDGGATWSVLEPGPANTAACTAKQCWVAGPRRIVRVPLSD
jgi:photosystem II stability/assembly factor-like uncharacterized protein